MSIALTEDHVELGSVVRDFTIERKVRAEARALLDASEEQRPTFWKELAEVGWLGLHVADEYGGSGYGIAELVVVVEELGRAVAPGPFLPTVIASSVLGHADEELRGRWLPELVDGSLTAGVGLASSLEASGDAVSGKVGAVLGAPLADILMLIDGDDVLIVESSANGLSVETKADLDPTRRSGKVTLTDTPVTRISGIGSTALALTRTLVAAEAVGGAQDTLESAVAYAKVREQFGRTIGSFQAVKHHCANMLVGAEAATAAVWDAARAADEGVEAFGLTAASAATLALPAYSTNAELNIQVHGGIGFTWEHDAHLHLRRATVLKGLFGGQEPARDVFTFAASGIARANSLDLPPEAEELRVRVRADIADIAAAEGEAAQREKLIETGYVMPHWPKPWGRAADAVEQLVIEEELAAAGVKRPEYSITGWVILTLIQHGTQDQIDRFVKPALLGDEIWCQLFSEPDAGSDAAAVKTRATRVDGGWRINGQKVWTSGAHLCKRGLATVRTDPEAPKHKGITAVLIDMSARGVEVRPLRQITGGAEFNEVFFTDVFVPDADVVGEPNDGWTVARATLGNERVSIGGGTAGSEGAATYMLKLAERYADGLEGSRVKIGEFLAVEDALRLLNLRRVARSVADAGPGPEGNVTKLLLAEHISDRARLSAELIGPDVAFLSGAGKMAGLLVLAARGMSIAGGTSEITRNQIAERILGLPRDPLNR
ncbi:MULTISPECIES: acyl-CoA dehydrogenase [Gordonia]|uniref:Acyl-CoA dehydrogenase n=1 Tax=Gordonia amicalis TaxID=89053 RepID=A0ABU4DDP1_9ACTN|nr:MULTISPECIES: acyl-CoA dehydrogenase [Gordonia]ATD72290.1 acyl-CoA dehydrogenase [Gordonia sp. 1D]MCR8895986.1 acyl-CoA dehydrogenase [Gordonia sp. GONU]MCZ4651543.1 acyl-CoA dehydrogenase [Gordonia amicalis]MDJ0452576.1 acyl-CoA dehydrogenase [Gordonia amicalis]MDV6307850.1 acyl-CoA dehydrogenase [Gordonia amicalis]